MEDQRVNVHLRSDDLFSAPDVLDESVWESLRELQEAGEPDLASELIDIYLADTPVVCEAVRQAIDANDAGGLRQAAHRGKGSSANLGAVHLSELFEVLEHLGRSGTTAGGRELMACALAHKRAGV
jgi:two-component system, sensor histidine kinase and response regulator